MATKKAAPKKKPVKKTTARKSTARSTSRAAALRSFKLSRPETPFLTIAITKQTIYWVIISLAVLALGLWIIKLQNEINAIYDTIEQSQAQYSTIDGDDLLQ